MSHGLLRLLTRAQPDDVRAWLSTQSATAAIRGVQGWTEVGLWRDGAEPSEEALDLPEWLASELGTVVFVVVPAPEDRRGSRQSRRSAEGSISRIAADGSRETVGESEAYLLPDVPDLLLSRGPSAAVGCAVIRHDAVPLLGVLAGDGMSLAVRPLDDRWTVVRVDDGDAATVAYVAAEAAPPAVAVVGTSDEITLLAMDGRRLVEHTWGSPPSIVGLEIVPPERREGAAAALGLPRTTSADLRRVVLGSRDADPEVDEVLTRGPSTSVPAGVLDHLGIAAGDDVRAVLEGGSGDDFEPVDPRSLRTALVDSVLGGVPRWFVVLCVVLLPVVLALTAYRAVELVDGRLGWVGAVQLVAAPVSLVACVVLAIGLWRGRGR